MWRSDTLDAACYRAAAAAAFDHRTAAEGVVGAVLRAANSAGVSVLQVVPFGSNFQRTKYNARYSGG
eukprot:CAMPEP_0179857380 /NCGR_PEP_ID=MMETSP0982-20121206/11721_1 /TAXON_ID=483367 /ORGANISM="non described non described, Strain CCMP 2436" /LENGTH=66 /DNA_ID=CAMNT_0021743899 /DNA_START=93 /DNA_END=289 /DNA_ORIENTATION=+